MEDELTVFVVDDDQGIRDALSFFLEMANLKVEPYATAQEFLDNYDPARPGCLVLDVDMPGMNGLELQETLGVRQSRLPIIFLTGRHDTATHLRAIKGGAAGFIEKPFHNQVLLDCITSAWKGHIQTKQKEIRA